MQHSATKNRDISREIADIMSKSVIFDGNGVVRAEMTSEMQTHKFKIGDIINSSLCSAKIITDIRIGVQSDFPTRLLKNGKEFRLSFENELCYIMKYIGGKELITVCSVRIIDNDYHLKGSEMFEFYEQIHIEQRNKN